MNAVSSLSPAVAPAPMQQGEADLEISALEALYGDRVELCQGHWSNGGKRLPCDEIATHRLSCPTCPTSAVIGSRHVAAYAKQPERVVTCTSCLQSAPLGAFPLIPLGGSK